MRDVVILLIISHKYHTAVAKIFSILLLPGPTIPQVLCLKGVKQSPAHLHLLITPRLYRICEKKLN